jgi:hypothetical protein
VGLSLLFVMVYLLILRPVKKQVIAMLEAPLRPPSAAPGRATSAVRSELTGEAAATGGAADEDGVPHLVTLKKTLVMKVKEDPKGASRLVQNWLRETEPTK